MAFENLILLAPCHGIEDFPLYHTGDDAASLLACWTSLWHPKLLAGAKTLPRVERCDYPPEDLTRSLFVLPKPCESEMSSDLPAEIEAASSTLIRGDTVDRNAILKVALASYPDTPLLDAETTKDFLAFGFTLLQVELLTQQMRYSSSVDQSRIARLVLDAARLAVDGDVQASREKLILCHDAVADERSHYYPVDVFFLDLTLLVESTVSQSQLDRLWDDEIPANILASGEMIVSISDKFPEASSKFQQAVESGVIGIVGGEHSEQCLPLMSPDSAMRQIQHGAESWKRVVGHAPQTFARRRSGIYPSLGHVLRCAGFDSVLHMKFDEGKYPESSQSKTGWLANGAELLPSLARQPLNANAHHSFLDLPRELSDAMDTDFVAVRAFWHWAGHVTPWYEDLRRACRFGTALGKFVTVDAFFRESANSTARDGFSASSYSYPYLTQSAARREIDPVSRWMRYWQGTIGAMQARGGLLMAGVLGGECDGMSKLDTFERRLDNVTIGPDDLATINKIVAETRDALSERLDISPNPQAKTVINPLPFARRILVADETRTNPATGVNVYATAYEGGAQRTLVDVPAMGFATISFDRTESNLLEGPDLAEGMNLRNEFLHVAIDEVTGAMRSLRDYGSRTTRVSQQLGLRITIPKTGQHWIDRQAPVAYSVMAADRAEITANGKMFAEITTAGRMLAPNGDVVGGFEQRFQLTRGSRILNIEIEIQPQFDLLLGDEPWNSYYASRFAFGDESALLLAGRHFQSQEVLSRRLEAPLFVDIDTPKHRTTIFTGGLPYHRRATENQLDTLLVTGGTTGVDEETTYGETARRFRLGVGVGIASPTMAALDWMAQRIPAVLIDGAPSASAGWLFHVTAKNVLVSSWEQTEQRNTIRMRLVETIGRRTKFKLLAFRPWVTMLRETHHGADLGDIDVSDGAADISLAPYEIVELVGSW